MKKLTVLFTLCLGLPALAADKVISVTFASVAATPSKSGETLDPRLFSFGKAVPGAISASASV